MARRKKATCEGVIAMLEDAEATLDVDAVVAFLREQEERIEALRQEAAACETLVGQVTEALGLEDASHGDIVACVTALTERAMEVESLRSANADQAAELGSLQGLLDERRQKLCDEIVGLMEVLRRPEPAIERLKSRAESMSFEELDAEYDEQRERFREVYRVPRMSRGEEDEPEELMWRDLRGYRV